MRVLITTDVVGGVWQFTYELAVGLLRDGCQIALVSFGGDTAREQQRQCEILSMRYDDAFTFSSSNAPLEWMEANETAYSEGAPVLIQMANEFAPDLLLSSQYCFGALPLRVPKLITAHSDVLSWAEACRNRPLEDSTWLRTYCRLVIAGLGGAAAVIAPTRWMLDALKRNFPLPQQRAVIPNGRNVACYMHDRREFRAVTAGRLWDEAKDIAILKDVSSPFPLFAAGPMGLGVTTGPLCPANITCLGKLSEEDLLQFFTESAIYICTSRYEPFGLAPLEAALCGCAVVARDIASLHEVWHDGAQYFSDAVSLSNLLEELAADPGLLARAQQLSFARAQTYTSQRMVKSYLSQFAMVLRQAEAPAYVA